jgi:uncharacterized membrane protein
MKTRFNNLWGKVTASYWFVPALMCIAAMTGASLALRSGRGASVLSNHGWLAWASVNTADGARELLSTIASSTITVAGVIFSITVLALSFASSQYGPRLLRNFMRDRLSQVVLGAFLSTYLYCLLVLRTLGAEAETLKLPHVAIAGALVLGIVTMAVLIVFIHHLARSMQVSSIVDAVGQDMAVLIRDFRTRGEESAARAHVVDSPAGGSFQHVIHSHVTGYVQALAREDLLDAAVAAGGTVSLRVRPGDYVDDGLTIATVLSQNPDLPPSVVERVRSSVVVGSERTNEQDMEFPIDQLAEIAVRALSPGVNDPFTAILCINRLGSALNALTVCRWPEFTILDSRGIERVRLLPMSMPRMLQRAYGQILHYGGSNPVIGRQVMKMLAQAADRSQPAHVSHIARFADQLLDRAAAAGANSSADDLREWHDRIRATVNRRGDSAA